MSHALGIAAGLASVLRLPVLAAAELGLLLAVGRFLGELLGLRHWGLPEALLAGLFGLLAASATPLDLVPQAVIGLWSELPTALLTLVFATLLLAKPLPAPAGLWRPVTSQTLLALTLAFGQYLVGGLVVLLLLQPRLGVHPLMACLLESGYEGGHGSAAAMGPIYARLGFAGGPSQGLAIATVGLLASTLLGAALVVLARQRGWLRHAADPAVSGDPSPPATPVAAAARPESPAVWALNLALAGLAVLVGLLLLLLLRRGAALVGGGLEGVVDSLPVFPLALLGSLLVRLLLDGSGRGGWASSQVQGQLGTVAADLLITAATASVDLSLLRQDWLPLLILALVGLGWNLLVLLLLAPRILPDGWFERGITEFGQATGVVASGVLLLRMADPEDRSDALTAFSIKQLLLQPLLAGGLITVLAPMAVSHWGLPAWTLLCLALVLLWMILAFALREPRP